MNILISGGTGFIGQNLCKRLIADNHNITILTRNKSKAQNLFGDKVTIIDYSKLKAPNSELKIDCIINLSGEPLANGRWTSKTKDKIICSRVDSTRFLVDFIKNQPSELKVKTLINSSAIGFYDSNQTEIITENSPSGNGFLSEVCQKWEAEAIKAEEFGVKVVRIRTGIVLDTEGVLKRMLLPFNFYIGGPLGNGKQIMSWIHIDDLISVFLFALNRNEINGPVNATSPNPVSMKDFCKELSKALHKPSWFKVPEFILRIVFDEMADVILDSQKVIPEKLIKSDFKFKYPYISDAIRNLINRRSH